MKKLIFFLFVYCFANQIFAQNFSNKGTDFWVAYGYHVKMTTTGGNGQDMVLYFATDGVTNITITIPALGYTQTLSSGAVPTVLTSAPIPKTGAQDARLTAESTAPENKAIHIVSDRAMVAYAHIYNQNVSGASILFPANTLGKEYYSINYTQISNENYSNGWLYVIATDTGTTTVEITPSANTINHAAGVPFTIAMTQGQVFNLMGELTGGGGGGGAAYTGVDLTGSKIKSIASGTSACKRIAVFSGSGKLSVTCSTSSSSSDNYMVQSFPKDAWGKKYLTAPTSSLNHNVYRICVLDPATQVTLNGAPITYPLVNNFYYEVPQTTLPLKIESDLPITVAQYISSQGSCGNSNSSTNPGDPEVIYLSPVEQNISKVIWNATPNFNILEHYYNVVIPNGGSAISSFKLDGVTVNPSSFTVHPQDPTFSYLSAQLASSGVHIIESDSGFNAIAYGFGSAESYGYNAGTNIKPFVPIRAYNPLNISGSTVACSGTNAYLTLTFPFQPTSLNLDFHNSPYQTPNTNVSISDPTTIFDSIHIEGTQQYWCYHLPTFYYFNVNNPSLDSSSYQITINGGTNSVEGCGNSFISDYDLFVYNPAKVKFSWANNGCVNDPVLFTDTTNYANNTFSYVWNWDFDDNNTTSTSHNPTHLFSAPGTYNVNFSLVTNVGCVSDTTIAVTVYPLSYGTVSGTTAVCQNATAPTLTFNATSGTSPFIFNYSINGGTAQSVTSTTNTATVAAPTSAVGTFSYTLNSIQGAACLQLQNATPSVVTINPLPTATIAGTINVCQYSTSPLITFTGAGATAPYTFTYKINNGSPLTVTTTTGNAATVSVPTNTIGTFTYTLLSVKDGSSTACVQNQTGAAVVIVNGLPTATIAGATAVCLNATAPNVTFTGANGIAPYTFTYTINGGAAQTTTTVSGNSISLPVPTNISGTFIYQLVSVKESSSTQCTNLQNGNTTFLIYREPQANFTYNPPACPQKTIQFNDQSIAYFGTVTEWHWNFADGSPVVTTQNPIHTFALAGTYNVKLYIKTSNGCLSPEITIPVTINPTPVVGFINPEVCLSDTYAQFIDTSSVPGGTITGWLWDFSDPISGVLNTSTLQNPRHSYSTIGTKNVVLIATTNSGCKDTVTQSFFVNGDIPVAGFDVLNPNGLCANDSVGIKNTSTVNVGSVVKVQIYWDYLGDPATFQNDDYPYPNKIYKHLYANFQSPLTKTFRIRFRAYSGETCINDYYQTITVNAAPKVLFNVIPDTCRYINPFQITQASEIGGVPGTYVFTGTGISSSGIFNPAVSGYGVFLIHYNYTSTAGCSDSAQRTIKILQPPVSNFGISAPACEGKLITFTDTCVSPVGSLTTWTWNFSDGSPSLIRNTNTAFTHVFATAGTYGVHLFVTTNQGCNSRDSVKQLLIHPQPLARYTFTDTACLPFATIDFTNTSTIADATQNSFSYVWNFGDASSGSLNSSIAIDPSHIYTAVGPFNVKLKVTSGAGCVDDTTISINTIHPQPHADFAFTKPSVCIGDEIRVIDLSNNMDGNRKLFFWEFGDGFNTTLLNPSHTYSDTGIYEVTHYVVNSFGCMSDTMIKPINVYPYPVITAGPDLQILEGQSAPLQAAAFGTQLQYLWTSGTYLNNTNILNPICAPINDIDYMLTVTGIGGCPSIDQVHIDVLKMPLIPNTFSPNKDGINDFWEIEYLKRYPKAFIQVFTRTGQKVYESRGYLKPWDGTKAGVMLPVDTYYYIIEPESGRAPVTGYVTIIR